jgi:hypothetical protein
MHAMRFSSFDDSSWSVLVDWDSNSVGVADVL